MSAWFSALPIVEQVFFFIAAPASLIMLIQTILLFVGGGDGGEPADTGLDSDTSGIDIDQSGADAGFDWDGGADVDFDGVDGPDGFSADLPETPEVMQSDQSADGAGHVHDANGHLAKTQNFGLRFITLRTVIAFLTVSGWTGVLCMELGLPAPLSGLIAAVCGFGAMVGIAYLVQSLMSLQSSGNIDYRWALGQICDVYLTIPAGGTGSGKVHLTLGGALTECDAITEGDAPIRTGSLVRVTDVVRDSVLVVEQAVSDIDKSYDSTGNRANG